MVPAVSSAPAVRVLPSAFVKTTKIGGPFTMRLNPTIHRRVRAMAAVKGWPVRRVLEQGARELYERLPEKERKVVDGILSLPETDEEEKDE